MSTALRWLGLDSERWSRVEPQSVWSATATVFVAAWLLVLVRFGGLVGDAPRAALRLALISVWGWIGLSAAIVLMARLFHPAAGWSVRRTVTVVGMSHVPMLIVAVMTLIAGGMLQILGPGRFVAVFTLAAWLPASLIVGISVTAGMRIRRAAAIVIVPYVIWLALIARHVIGQIEHLL